MNRRQFLATSATLAAGPTFATPSRKTVVTVEGDAFRINGKPTYAGRSFRGHRVEGLLMNARMVQATFDDLNPATRDQWAYPDTKAWDAERNVREFLAAMPTWRAHGLLAVTVCLQGGSPQGYSKAQPWENNAFDPDGTLRPAYLDRMRRVLDRADELGMVVILGYFYFGQDQRLKDESAVRAATVNATDWLVVGGYRNVIVEVANECNNRAYDHDILKPARIVELIRAVRERGKPLGLMVGVSLNGNTIPTPELAAASDVLLIHGNGVKEPKRIAEMVRQSRAAAGDRKRPVVYNEDDHFDFDKPENNMLAAVGEYASWGYFDYRMAGEGFADGYQSVPVDWGIGSPRKKAFFGLLKEVTGGG
ncbi:MAG: hypothetical protein U0746_03565 [Gemmataceae bacterium]